MHEDGVMHWLEHSSADARHAGVQTAGDRLRKRAKDEKGLHKLQSIESKRIWTRLTPKMPAYFSLLLIFAPRRQSPRLSPPQLQARHGEDVLEMARF